MTQVNQEEDMIKVILADDDRQFVKVSKVVCLNRHQFFYESV